MTRDSDEVGLQASAALGAPPVMPEAPIDLHPSLSERYGPDNPGSTPEEQNLFAQGALWWGDKLAERRHR